jgi:hypothetical protein
MDRTRHVVSLPQNITIEKRYPTPKNISANLASASILVLKNIRLTAKTGVKGASLPCGVWGSAPQKELRKKELRKKELRKKELRKKELRKKKVTRKRG